jgi:hypothetical protein
MNSHKNKETTHTVKEQLIEVEQLEERVRRAGNAQVVNWQFTFPWMAHSLGHALPQGTRDLKPYQRPKPSDRR